MMTTWRWWCALAAIATGCGGSNSGTPSAPVAPTPVPTLCAYIVPPDKVTQDVAAEGADLQIPLTTLPSCHWLISNQQGVWVDVLNGKNFFDGSDTLRLRITPNPGPERTGTITVQGQLGNGEYVQQTLTIHQQPIVAPVPAVPSFFWINSIAGSNFGFGLTMALTDTDGTMGAIMGGDKNSFVSASADTQGPVRRNWSVTMGAPLGTPLKVGTYDAGATQSEPRLSFGRSEISNCSSFGYGRFTIHELQVQPVTNQLAPRVDRLRASFEYHCGSLAVDPVFGEIWYVRR